MIHQETRKRGTFVKRMRKGKILLVLAAVVLFCLYVLFNHMNLNPIYPESAFVYCVLATAWIAIFTLDQFGRFTTVENQTGSFNLTFVRNGSLKRWPLFVAGGLWAVYLLVFVGSSVLFQVNAFRDQMPTLTQMDFADDFDTVGTNQLPIVDQAMAAKLADKKLGERPSLGSQVVLGEPTLQQVNGELLWAVPTYHSGLFKWLTNMDGTPGYVTVSATNPAGCGVCGRLCDQIPTGCIPLAGSDVLRSLCVRTLHRSDRL